jgi:hypothetical protein
MLPKQINGLVGTYTIKQVDKLPGKRAQIDPEKSIITIKRQHSLLEINSLFHEMVHLAFTISRGYLGKPDEREEPTCIILGRFLPKIIADNPEMINALCEEYRVLGLTWGIEETEYPSEDEDDIVCAYDHRNLKFKLSPYMSDDNKVLRVFGLVCELILDDCRIIDTDDNYYQSMYPVLFALLRANPEVVKMCGDN